MRFAPLLLIAASIGFLTLSSAEAAEPRPPKGRQPVAAAKPQTAAPAKKTTAPATTKTTVPAKKTKAPTIAKAPSSKTVAAKAAPTKAAKATPVKTTKTAPAKAAKTTKKPTTKAPAVASAKRPAAKAPAARPSTTGSFGSLALQSNSVLILDQRTGQTVYQKNATIQTPIASITKLMTAMVTLDAGLPLDQQITLSWEDVDTLKGTHSRVPLGNSFSRNELLHMALIASENRAAAALSRAYPGGRPAFVQAMNRKARELGMDSTRFVDGTGLSSSNQSTAADLTKMVAAASRYPLISEITTTGSYQVQLDDGARRVAFTNTNSLTRSSAWHIAVSKTGYIREAGHCLVMQADVGNQSLIFVLLDSQGKYSRIGDANRIKQWLETGGSARLAKAGPDQHSA